MNSIDGMIKSNLNYDLVSISDDNRNFGIEIGQYILNEDRTIKFEYIQNLSDYEFFKTENEALARVEYINNMCTIKWENIGSYETGKYYDKALDLFKSEELLHLELESNISFKEWLDNYGSKDVSLDTSLEEFKSWVVEEFSNNMDI